MTLDQTVKSTSIATSLQPGSAELRWLARSSHAAMMALALALALLLSLAGSALAQQTLYIGNDNIIQTVAPDGSNSTYITPALGLDNIQGIAFDRFGNLFVASESDGGSIVKFAPDGKTSKFAINLGNPTGLAFDAVGNLYVTDTFFASNRVVKISAAGSQSTFAIGFQTPTGIALDSAGFAYVIEAATGNIQKVAPDGSYTSAAPFATGFDNSRAIVLGGNGNLYAANDDAITGNTIIYQITPQGVKSVFLDLGTTNVSAVRGLAFDGVGNLYASGFTGVWRFSPDGLTQTQLLSTPFASTSGIAFGPNPTNYTVTAVAVPATGGTILGAGFTGTPSAISGSFAAGSQPQLTAIPNTGFIFKDWTDASGTVLSREETYVLPLLGPGSPLNLKANFTRTFEVDAFTLSGGTVFPSFTQTVPEGENASFFASPFNGNKVDKWVVDGVIRQVGGDFFSLTGVNKDTFVQVTFIASAGIVPIYSLSTVASPNGVIVSDAALLYTRVGVNPIVSEGSSATFTATPAIGFAVNQWLVNGVARQSGGDKFTVTNITSNLSVQATFIASTGTPQNFPVTVQPSANGTVTADLQTVTSGGTVKFTAVPDNGYVVDRWLVNSAFAQNGGNSFMLNGIFGATSVQAIFIPNTGVVQNYTVTVLTSSQGTATPGTTTVPGGSSLTFTATPSAGYVVAQWLVDNVVAQVGGDTFTISTIIADQTLQVVFDIVGGTGSTTFTVTSLDTVNGTVTPSGNSTVTNGGNIVYTAVPATGYMVDQWLVNGVSVQTGGNKFNLNNVTSNQTVQATFVLVPTQSFVITTLANTGGTITSSAILIPSGGSVTFTATPNSGFVVGQWLVNGTAAQSGGNTFTLTNITADQTVQATFVLPYTDIFGPLTPSTPAGWVVSPWFGRFEITNFPTIRHERIGTIIYNVSREGGLWFYHPVIGFIYASPQTNGYVYALTPRKGLKKGYIYFVNPRKFYAFSTKKYYKIKL